MRINISDQTFKQLDAVYSSENLDIVKAACIKYDETLPVCQMCCFYSTSRHDSASVACWLWPRVFGIELQEQLVKFMNNGVKVGKKFMDIWQARKVHVDMVIPKKAVIQHSADVQNIAEGLTVRSINTQNKSRRRNDIPGERSVPGISVVPVTRGL